MVRSKSPASSGMIVRTSWPRWRSCIQAIIEVHTMLPEEAMRKLAGILSKKHKAALKAFLRRHALIRRLFASDLGILGRIHGTDKVWAHHYDRQYQAHFRLLRWNRLNLLEIGVGGDDNPDQGGNSLRMWKDYFPRATFTG